MDIYKSGPSYLRGGKKKDSSRNKQDKAANKTNSTEFSYFNIIIWFRFEIIFYISFDSVSPLRANIPHLLELSSKNTSPICGI